MKKVLVVLMLIFSLVACDDGESGDSGSLPNFGGGQVTDNITDNSTDNSTPTDNNTPKFIIVDLRIDSNGFPVESINWKYKRVNYNYSCNNSFSSYVAELLGKPGDNETTDAYICANKGSSNFTIIIYPTADAEYSNLLYSISITTGNSAEFSRYYYDILESAIKFIKEHPESSYSDYYAIELQK